MTSDITTAPRMRQPDPEVLEAFVGRVVGDLGATISAGLVVLGERLGLYRSLADGVPTTAEDLADRLDLAVAYVRPWLANQAAGGYLGYDAGTRTYAMSPEQAAALAEEDGPAYFAPSMELAISMLNDVAAIEERFRTGDGLGWHEHNAGLFVGTERFFRPGYVANLVPVWLPALDGVVEQLIRGARVADVGCGHGASTVLMAQAFPNSTFIGLDYHEASIVVARRRAEAAGVSHQTTFIVAEATELAAQEFDLVTMFDCLHDMGDPVGAAARIHAALAPSGTLMLVEPAAGDDVADNLHPLGRVFYAASTLVCTPTSLAQPGQAALGPQAGATRLTAVLEEAGFSSVRVAAQSPVNLIFEAKP
jgi:2-polyprenyl-3-methyl-5-hydroxy-6-metoxy-1,4-benzoquinol methylase